ncbi:MAG: CDP-diacylglycerol--serine O-phosphatidyltransferase [Neisseriaceae bacterium]
MKHVFNNRPQKGSPIFLLPSLITIGAMCAGFFAIFASANGYYIKAAHLIFLAIILDSLDGRVARLTHTASPFGAQMDSLSDMVNFGIAPALIIYNWHLHSLGRIGGIVVFIYAACAALRLARFNTMIGIIDKRFFLGLPSTASAPIIVGYVWLCHSYHLNTKLYIILGLIITLFCAFSMVNNVKFYSFKEFHFHHRAKFRVLLLSFIILILLVTYPELVIYSSFVLYLIISYFLHFLNMIRNRTKSDNKKTLISSTTIKNSNDKP